MGQMTVFVCGNFGYMGNHLDGQTVKTRMLKDEFAKRLGEDNVVYTDTSFIKTRPCQTFRDILRNFFRSTHVVILPDTSALKFLLPLFRMGNLTNRRDFRYVVIGGWLPELMRRNAFYRKMVAGLDGVYVETTEMDSALKKLKISNSKVLPNFRCFSFTPTEFAEPQLPLKLVYCARVLREKGIEDAIDAVSQLNRKHEQPVVTLDIFGPIQRGYDECFRGVIHRQDKAVKYNGILQQEELHEVLAQYDVMVFPTYYSAEGFPGTIIDSYISGLPIIASDWAYNSEFVLEGITGKLCRPRDAVDLASKIESFIRNPAIIHDMRKQCIKKSRQYHVDAVLPGLIADMGIL